MICALRRTVLAVLFIAWWGVEPVYAQIDPYRRELIQLGYNGALQGHAPLSAYAFYYRNEPGFLRTNLTLRLAFAPTYIDSELGISEALGQQTHLGVGLAGGGFADSYAEIREGKYLPRESFIGHGGEARGSVYHLFNPGAMIPLNGVVRGSVRYSAYADDDDTASNFELPQSRETFALRTGLRWGGREPLLFPNLAMELSVWYEGQYRSENGIYGYDDREVEPFTHNFWAQAMLVYTFPELKHSFDVSLTLGTSIDADRFSAYRLGALLPLISEYPLSMPGYYYQEISADQFMLFAANYLFPLDANQTWSVNLTAATAVVDYLEGLSQPGHSHTGVGAGLLYRSRSFKIMAGYAYGVDAIRSGGRGAHSIGLLLQLDWVQAKGDLFSPTSPNLWRGFQRVFGLFGN